VKPVRSGPAIQLPQWCARLAVPGAGDLAEGGPATSRRIGPLTVCDPDRGADVVLCADGASAVVFDGYLFDRRDLARELGMNPAAATDGEIAAAAYARWGRDVFDRLDGSYLLAVWDASDERLLVGHDALGQHPAFYARSPDGVWFSSNVLRLSSVPAVSTRPSRLALALLAFRYWPDAGQTHFDAIHRVRPGCYVEITRDGDVTEHKYFDPLPDDGEPFLPADRVLAEFEPALGRAVERCVALEPQGIMLSGGVDSVTVAALAVEVLKGRASEPLVAVSGRSGGPLSDEEVMQSRVAAALSMPHVISTRPEWLEGQDPVRRSLAMTSDLPSPGFVHWVGTYTGFYRMTAREGLTVLLTGAGGDNWLSVADAYAADLLRRLEIGRLYRFLKSDLTTGGRTLSNVARRRLWAFGARPLLDSAWAALASTSKHRYHRRHWEAQLPQWLCPDRSLREALVDSLLLRRTPSLTAGGRLPASYYRHSLRSYANPYMHHENENAFHVSAMCGLRLLSPYHDRRLVSFFMRIHPEVLIHGDRYKGLLRPVVARHLPHLGLERQKKAYPQAEQQRALEGLRQSMTAAWSDYSFDVLEGLGIVDASGLRRSQTTFAGADFEGIARSYGLMSAERWLRGRRAA
jgi:asparagine synthetase B (glutamine-hydrolysing)